MSQTVNQPNEDLFNNNNQSVTAQTQTETQAKSSDWLGGPQNGNEIPGNGGNGGNASGSGDGGNG